MLRMRVTWWYLSTPILCSLNFTIVLSSNIITTRCTFLKVIWMKCHVVELRFFENTAVFYLVDFSQVFQFSNALFICFRILKLYVFFFLSLPIVEPQAMSGGIIWIRVFSSVLLFFLPSFRQFSWNWLIGLFWNFTWC